QASSINSRGSRHQPVMAAVAVDDFVWPVGDRHRALTFATDVHTTMNYLKNPTITNKILHELSALVLEAMQCIEDNTPLLSSHLQQIAQFIPARSSTRSFPEKPLVKVGYSMIWLIEKLMSERYAQLPCASKQEEPAGPPSTETDQPLFHNPQDVKVEPVDVKEEPIDYVEDVKQEDGEEPLADVYCLSTGTTRELDPSEFARPVENMDGVISGGLSLMRRLGGHGIATKRLNADTPGPSTSSFTREASSNDDERIRMPFNQPLKVVFATPKETVPIRSCYLCCKLTGQFGTTPLQSRNRERLEFLKTINAESPEGRKRIHALRSNREIAYFCLSHIAVPVVERRKRQAVVKEGAANPTRVSSCDLCTQPRFPLSQSPSDAAERQRYFTQIILISAEQTKKIDWFLKNRQENAMICAKHFMKSALHPGTCGTEPHAKQPRLLSKARCGLCGRCGTVEYPMRVIPSPLKLRARFLTNLKPVIFLTFSI
ncbi:hypothetical protein PRIPAC_90727, partial [Pristionchus pacificus]